ncbi:MAG: MarR family transcriptional regulator [Candidatus Methanoplasma sp.]|nr:MarR family transcriptional regulator [Candidatus Methanoplasma sp.]
MTLHRGQGRVLSLLKLQPEIGQKELGYLLDMSKQALAGLLGKLEKNGYITRTESEKDRRSYIIKLTEKGRNVLEDRETEDDDLFECLNEEEQRNLSNYIDRIIAVLEEKVGVDDKDDYAEFFRERFFAEHGLDERSMPPFGRGRPGRGFGGRGGPDGFSESGRKRRRNDRHE